MVGISKIVVTKLISNKIGKDNSAMRSEPLTEIIHTHTTHIPATSILSVSLKYCE